MTKANEIIQMQSITLSISHLSTIEIAYMNFRVELFDHRLFFRLISCLSIPKDNQFKYQILTQAWDLCVNRSSPIIQANSKPNSMKCMRICG